MESKAIRDLENGLEEVFGVFQMPEVTIPVFPDKDFNIMNYGAIGDGIHMNTNAIANAIEECTKSGGGRVIIPVGIWLTGPIGLKSNVNLHVERGAVVVFSKNFDDYPLILSSFEGLETVRCTSPIHGKDLENIAITGEGIFDGSGEVWRPVKKFKMTEMQWDKLVKSGGVLDEESQIWWPTQGALEGQEFFKKHKGKIMSIEACKPYRDYMRPNLLSLIGCKKVLLDGPTFQNSPAWNLHPLLCEDVTIRNVSVRNAWFSQNGDGLDLESCKNVQVYNSSFDVGDDAICMKSGKDEDGRKMGVSCENVRIYGCTVYHGHGGFVVGSEMSGGVKNIHISDCTFLGTDVGLRFKSCRGRGGVVEDIYIENIRMKDIPGEGIIFTTFYENHSKSSKEEKSHLIPVTEETPEFRNIYIRNTNCINAGTGIQISGLPELPINNVYFHHLLIIAHKGMECSEGMRIGLKDIQIQAREEPVLSFYNSKDIEVVDVRSLEETDVSMEISGDQSSKIQKS